MSPEEKQPNSKQGLTAQGTTVQEQRPSLKAGVYHSLGQMQSQLEQWHYSTLHNFIQCQRRGPGPMSVLPEITNKGFLHSKLIGPHAHTRIEH